LTHGKQHITAHSWLYQQTNSTTKITKVKRFNK
jgi:hypothetical protein